MPIYGKPVAGKHGRRGPSDFADELQHAADRHYGHASRAFLAALVSDMEGARAFVRDQIDGFLRQHCPKQDDGQVRRVAKRFALIGSAGELATRVGIVPWTPEAAKVAAGRCYADWLYHRGDAEPEEIRRGIAAVQKFIRRHEASRIAGWEQSEPPQCAGFRRATKGDDDIEARQAYYLYPEAFREACAGINASGVAKALAARGVLALDSKRKPKVHRLPNGDTRRMYIISDQIFEL